MLAQLWQFLVNLLPRVFPRLFDQPIGVSCAAHNVSPSAESDVLRVNCLDDLVVKPALPTGLPWLEYSPPLLKKHGLVLGYEYNYGDGTYLWTYYDPKYLDAYSNAFDENAESVFDMYVDMVTAGHGVLYLGSDKRLIDYNVE